MAPLVPGLDAAQRRGAHVVEVVHHAKDVDAKLREALRAHVKDVLGPRGPDRGEAHAVGHVEHGAQLLADSVGREVAHQASAGEAAVRERAGPHEVGAGLVARGVGQGGRHGGAHGAHEALGHGVDQLRALLAREVALHRVHHDVRARRSRLEGGQRVGELGVHDGKERAGALVVVRALEDLLAHRVDVDDGGVGGLRAGAGERGDGAELGDLVGGHLVEEEVLQVEVVSEAVGDRLGGVDGRAATDGEDEVHALATAELHALLHERQARVGHDAVELDVGDAGLVHALLDAVEKPGVADVVAAPVDEGLRAAELLDEPTGLALGVLAEDDLGRDQVLKVNHNHS